MSRCIACALRRNHRQKSSTFFGSVKQQARWNVAPARPLPIVAQIPTDPPPRQSWPAWRRFRPRLSPGLFTESVDSCRIGVACCAWIRPGTHKNRHRWADQRSSQPPAWRPPHPPQRPGRLDAAHAIAMLQAHRAHTSKFDTTLQVNLILSTKCSPRYADRHQIHDSTSGLLSSSSTLDSLGSKAICFAHYAGPRWVTNFRRVLRTPHPSAVPS